MPVGPPAPQPTAPKAKAPAKVAKPAAKAAKGSVTVTWKVPRANGAPVLSYRVTSSAGKTIVVRGSVRKVVFKKLKKGRAFTFRVTAINQVGAGTRSSWSKKVKVK
ncbi:fibronectin type III domain-containing protein [Aeromicrobium sp. zg-Y869]|nr:fibronectin type III domain-containing protein [Aeromicrobium wangtongii]